MKESNIWELSEQWPESIRWAWRLKFCLPAIVAMSWLAFETGLFPSEKTLPISLAIAGIYIIGKVFDQWTTENCIKVQEGADKADVPIDLCETNAFLPKKPTKNDLYGKVSTIIDVADMIPAIIFPPVTILLTGISIYAGMKNNYLAHEADEKIEVYKLLMKR